MKTRPLLYAALILGVPVVAFLIAEPRWEKAHNTDIDDLGGMRTALPLFDICVLVVFCCELFIRAKRRRLARETPPGSDV